MAKKWVFLIALLSVLGSGAANADSISIGLGDRNNPQPGGSGRMYFDDIRLYGQRSAP